MGVYEILRVALDALAWTPFVAPMEMDAFSIRCDDGDLRIRTNSADANTEDVLAAGNQDVINAPVRHHRGELPRFREGSTVLYLRMASGTGTAIVKSVESPNPSPRPRAD